MNLDEEVMNIQVKHLDHKTKEISYKKQERCNLNDIEKEAKRIKDKLEKLSTKFLTKTMISS